MFKEKQYPKGNPRRYAPSPWHLRVIGKIHRFITWTIPKKIKHLLRK